MPGPEHNDAARVRDVYDRVAARYADAFGDELAAKPMDRMLLQLLADDVRGRGGGRVADVGTGPGHVARFLADRGLDVVGVDLAPAMIAEARARHPGLTFEVGDHGALGFADGALAAMTSFYAIVHLTAPELAPVLAEAARVLAPGGAVLVAFHVGDEAVRPGEMLGEPVDVAWNFLPMAAVCDALVAAGLAVELRLDRAPYPTEHPCRRGYVMARKPR